MKYRRLDSNDDYVFGNGKYELLQDADAVAQAVKTNLLLLKGEWWEDTEQGLPLFDEILGAAYSVSRMQAVDLLIKNTIQQTTGVLSIESYSSSYEDRNISIQCTIDTKYGTASLEVSL